MAAYGLAAYALFPELSVAQWGILHSVIALFIVLKGKYKLVEKLMRVFIALMFVVTIISAVLIQPDIVKILKGIFTPQIPAESV